MVRIGVGSRPRGRQPGVPIARSLVGKMLTDRYYLGQVQYKGVWYRGAHKQTISHELFAKVQEVRASHNKAGDKRRKHRHHLKGTLFCGHCGYRFGMSPSTGNGGTYDYFYCIGRHRGGNCPQPYVTVDQIEPQVDALYRSIKIRPAWRERIRACLHEDADIDLARRQATITDQQKRLAKLAKERKNLAVSIRQAPRLAGELNAQLDDLEAQERAANKLIADADMDQGRLAKVFADAEKLIDYLGEACHIDDFSGRRLLNQFFFEKIYIRDNRISAVIYTETARLILGLPPGAQDPFRKASGPDQGPDGAEQDHKKNHRPQGDGGLETDSVVGAAGVEPATARV